MKRRLQHRSAAAGLALALALGAVGCSDDAPPAGSPVPSDSSSATATASVPALPAEARGRGPKAAEAFVRHYVDLINYGLRTLDSEPLAAASSEDCEACDYFIDALAATKQRDGRYVGGTWTIEDLRQYPHGPEAEVNIRAIVTLAREKVIQNDPRKVARLPERRTAYSFILTTGNAGFSVKDIIGVAQ